MSVSLDMTSSKPRDQCTRNLCEAQKIVILLLLRLLLVFVCAFQKEFYTNWVEILVVKSLQ